MADTRYKTAVNPRYSPSPALRP